MVPPTVLRGRAGVARWSNVTVGADVGKFGDRQYQISERADDDGDDDRRSRERADSTEMRPRVIVCSPVNAAERISQVELRGLPFPLPEPA